jgi:hypothetical protein
MTRRPLTGRRKAARDRAQLGLDACADTPVEAPSDADVPGTGERCGDASASWACEVELLPARCLRWLPIPTTLVCRSHDVRWVGSVALRTARAAPIVDGLPDFVGLELEHITLAAEHDRAQMSAWCARKLAGPWVLSAAVATGQAELGERLVPRGWSLGRVLHRLALRIERVELCP